METPSYFGKGFVMANLAKLMDERNLAELTSYSADDLLPQGAQIGQLKTLPAQTDVIVLETKLDTHKKVYAKVQPISGDSNLPSGWTFVENIRGGLMNELIGFTPSDWALPPQGDNFTVIDRQALIRTGAPHFKSTNQIIPQKTFLFVLEQEGNFAQVALAVPTQDGSFNIGATVGWTSKGNLMPGFGTVYFTPAWTNKTGFNACWEKGNYIGAKLLVNIVGTKGDMEQLTYEMVEPYLKMKDAAEQVGVVLGINSGFRTYPEQALLRKQYDQRIRTAATARPGFSNHQHGPALDIQTGGFGTTIYNWLKANAPRFGFLRTVSNEPWHWEYRPDEARRYGYKRPSVSP